MANKKTLIIQSILFNNYNENVKFSIEHLANAALYLRRSREIEYVELMLGDCSPNPVFQNSEIKSLNALYRKDYTLDKISYHFFNKNLGSAAGHNALLNFSESEYQVIINPDVVVAPNTLLELYNGFTSDDIGIVEARQIPLEHPKDYDNKTGDTSWASTACIMTKTKLAKQINGFDSESFFLYCDDVDFSWRMKLAGYRVIYKPSAVIFHDKRLTVDAKHETSEAEIYYSAEAALMLARKYSRPDLLKKILIDFKENGNFHHKKAAAEFNKKLKLGSLPDTIDADHCIAQFTEGNFAKHRF